jgi:hypothetical protein
MSIPIEQSKSVPTSADKEEKIGQRESIEDADSSSSNEFACSGVENEQGKTPLPRLVTPNDGNLKRTRKSPIDYKRQAKQFQAPKFYTSPDMLYPTSSELQRRHAASRRGQGGPGSSGVPRLRKQRRRSRVKAILASNSEDSQDDRDLPSLVPPRDQSKTHQDLSKMKENLLNKAILAFKHEQAKFPPIGN